MNDSENDIINGGTFFKAAFKFLGAVLCIAAFVFVGFSFGEWSPYPGNWTENGRHLAAVLWLAGSTIAIFIMAA